MPTSSSSDASVFSKESLTAVVSASTGVESGRPCLFCGISACAEVMGHTLPPGILPPQQAQPKPWGLMKGKGREQPDT